MVISPEISTNSFAASFYGYELAAVFWRLLFPGTRHVLPFLALEIEERNCAKLLIG